MNVRLASTRVILGCIVAGGLALAACDDDETTPGPTPTGAGTTAGTQTGSGGGTGTGGGTTTGTGTVTPPTCQEACVDILALGCNGGPATADACEAGCEASRVYCETEVQAAAVCAGEDPTYVCDGDGNPVIEGCDSQYAAIRSCSLAVLQGCADNCPAVVAAACTNGPPDVGSCQAGCAAVTITCPEEYEALDTCAGATPTYECNASDQPMPQGCDTQHAALMTCMAGG